MPMDAQAVAKYLTMLFEKSGETYQDVDNACGVPKSTFSRLLRGMTANPQASTVSTLVSHFGGSMDELAGITKDMKENPPAYNDLAAYLESTRHQYERQISDLIDNYEARIADLKSTNEAHLETARKVARQRLRWIVILAVALAAIVAWFIWDLTHPEIGLIRLKQAGYLGQLLGLK